MIQKLDKTDFPPNTPGSAESGVLFGLCTWPTRFSVPDKKTNYWRMGPVVINSVFLMKEIHVLSLESYNLKYL